MAKLFLSYAREDAATAGRLARALERAGHEIWWDRELTAGSSFGPEIEQQLKDCDVVIVIWSAASVRSPWVRDEAAIGRDAGKLLPLALSGTEPPIGFRQFHTIELAAGGRVSAVVFRKVEQAIRASAGERQSETAPPAALPRPHFRTIPTRAMLAAAIMVALAVIAGLYLTLWRSSGGELSVAVVPASAAPMARDYASDIGTDMAPVLAAHAENASVADSSGDVSNADYKLSVAASPNGAGAHASLAMSSRRERGILWSKRWNVPNLGAVDLKQQMSLLGSQAMLCAIEGHNGNLDQQSGVLGIYVSACAADSDPDTSDDELTDMFAKVVRSAPRFAPAWGMLAILHANAADDARRAHDPTLARSIAEARAAIAQTRSLNPQSGKALLAEAILIGDPIKALPILDRAVEAEPQAYQIRVHRSLALQSVGRNHAAVEETTKTLELNPLSPLPRAVHIAALTYDGRFSEVRVELDNALKTWPNNPVLLEAAFAFHYRYGDPKVAEQLLPRTLNSSDADMVPFRKIIAARINPTPAKVEDAIATFRDMARIQPETVFRYFLAAGMFGRTEEDYALLSDPKFKPYVDSDFFFRPDLAHVRADPRFMRVAAERGLVHYWKTSGQWPDFCFNEKLRYDCKTEAAKYK
jgi:tetratricopeptide (TPR) repeat protein